RVPGPRVGVDLLEESHLLRKARRQQRIGVAVEVPVGALRWLGIGARISPGYRAHRIDGALQRALRHVARMGIAGSLAGHRAQTEALGRVIGCRLESPIVENETLGAAALEEEFAV